MDTTDTILGALAATSIGICCICIMGFVYCKKRPSLKQSRSDNELSIMIDQSTQVSS